LGDIVTTVGEKELAGVEILRFLCASLILIVHYPHFFLTPNIRLSFEDLLPLYSILHPVYAHGHLAVQMFWAISGFIFFFKYAGRIHERNTSWKQFFVYRFSRLYPLHVVTLAAVAVLQAIYFATHGWYFMTGSNDTPRFFAHLLMASSWFTVEGWSGWSFNAPIWSVSAEVLVYATFFILVFIARPSVVLCLVAIFAAHQFTRFEELTFPLSRLVFDCAKYFFLGGLVHQGLKRVPRQKWTIVCIWAGLSSSLLLILMNFVSGVRLLPILIGLLLLVFITAGQFIRGRWVLRASILGNMTYSSYLLHFPFQICLALAVDSSGWTRSIFSHVSVAVGYFVGTLLISYWTYERFERAAQMKIRSLVLTDSVSTGQVTPTRSALNPLIAVHNVTTEAYQSAYASARSSCSWRRQHPASPRQLTESGFADCAAQPRMNLKVDAAWIYNQISIFGRTHRTEHGRRGA
jgi:peptidoglycan/LPS O-acetylase OafA/YrhL